MDKIVITNLGEQVQVEYSNGSIRTFAPRHELVSFHALEEKIREVVPKLFYAAGGGPVGLQYENGFSRLVIEHARKLGYELEQSPTTPGYWRARKENSFEGWKSGPLQQILTYIEQDARYA